MLKIYDTLKNLISPELVSKASSTLGESTSKVSSAVSAILPSLLAGVLKEGDTAKLRDVVETAGTNNVYNELHNVYTGSGIFNNVNIGERFENAVLGGKNSSFVSQIANKAGIANSSADRLTNWVGATIAAFLGNKVVNGNETMSGLLSQLETEKGALIDDIPSDVYSTLGLSSVFGTRSKVTRTTTEPVKKTSGNGWIIWLIIILLLLVLLFFWWRSCNRNRVAYNNNYVTERVDTIGNRTAAAINNAADRTADAFNNTAARVRTELTLPDGKKINVYKNGCEDKMVAYLNSDDFKNASADDLKDKWFHIDNIEFEFGSASQLEEGSQEQLNNFVAILKNYPDVKVRIGGYADKVGSDEANMKLSEQRANYIKAQMERGGVNGNRILTQGFGEEYAVYPASAPDSLRQKDRDIALRFTK